MTPMAAETPATPPFSVGERFSRELRFEEDAIRHFALVVGDTNPLHHDAALAAKSRFGGMIASGTHTSSMIFACVADYVTSRAPSLGLDIACQFRRAVRAGAVMRVEWEIVAIEPKESLRGHVLRFSGRLLEPRGEVAAIASSTTLVPWGER